MNAAVDELATWDDCFTDPWVQSEVVLLQHGNLRNGRLWRGWVPYFGRRYRVLRPDFPGHGRSPDPGPDAVFSVERFVAAAVALLDRLEIERVHWVGESLGGVVGAALAGAHPDRVSTLTAISVPLRMDERRKSHAVGYASWEEAVTALGTRRWWLEAQGTAGNLVGDDAVDGYIADEVGRTPPHVAVANARMVASWNVAELIPTVQAPALFIYPERLSTIDRRPDDDIAALAPNGRLHTVPGVETGLFTYTEPDSVAPVVAEFIAEHEETL
jgi:pimeloyl-ACP methyl ester carboxylesterase